MKDHLYFELISSIKDYYSDKYLKEILGNSGEVFPDNVSFTSPASVVVGNKVYEYRFYKTSEKQTEEINVYSIDGNGINKEKSINLDTMDEIQPPSGIPFTYELQGTRTYVNVRGFTGGETGAVAIDWGDGSFTTYKVGEVTQLTKVYHYYGGSSTDRHTVKVYGDYDQVDLYTNVSSTYRNYIRKILSFGDKPLHDCKDAFKYLYNVEEITTDVTPKFVGDCSSMFVQTGKDGGLTHLNMDGWNLAEMTNSKSMFFRLGEPTLTGVSLKNTTVGLGIDISEMFSGIPTVDVTGTTFIDTDPNKNTKAALFVGNSNIIFDNTVFNTSGTTSFIARYQGTEIDISKLDITSFEQAGGIFSYCETLTNVIGDVNVPNASGVTKIFYNCKAMTNFPKVKTSGKSSIGYAFEGCSSATAISASSVFPNISEYMNIAGVFKNCTSLTSTDDIFSKYNGNVYQDVFYGATSMSGKIDVANLYIPDFTGETAHPYVLRNFVSPGMTVNGYGTFLDRMWAYNEQFPRYSHDGSESRYRTCTCNMGASVAGTGSRSNLIQYDNWTITDGES